MSYAKIFLFSIVKRVHTYIVKLVNVSLKKQSLLQFKIKRGFIVKYMKI